MAARGHQRYKLLQYLRQVIRAGEVLNHRIEDDRIIDPGFNAAQVVRVPLKQRYLRKSSLRYLPPHLLQHSGGEVCTTILAAMGGQQEQ